MKKQRDIEPDDFGDIVQRMMRAYLKRLSVGEIDDMIKAQKIAKQFRSDLKRVALEKYKNEPMSGERIAGALGMTRQGVHAMHKRTKPHGNTDETMGELPPLLRAIAVENALDHADGDSPLDACRGILG
jgi:hypothetical protein